MHLTELRKFKTQYVYLTATLPVSMEREFFEAMWLESPVVIRGATTRTDMLYEIREFSARQVLPQQIEWFQPCLRNMSSTLVDRALIFAPTVADVVEIQRMMNCEIYHSKHEDKQASHARWIMGESSSSKVMAATSAFGAGIDYPSIRFCFHVAPPRSMMDFIQETGRLGRDGRGSVSILSVRANWEQALPPDTTSDSVAKKAMRLYCLGSRCLLATLSRFQDGIEGMQYCKKDPVCSQCLIRGCFRATDPDEQDHTLYWDILHTRANSVSTDYGEFSELSDNEFANGPEIYKREVHAQSTLAVSFEDNIQKLGGICPICLAVDTNGPQQYNHKFENCGRKGHFLKDKMNAPKKLFQGITSCFTCFMPQYVCCNRGNRSFRCKYKDMLLPMVWSLYSQHEVNKKSSFLHGIDVPEGDLVNVTSFLSWCGQETNLDGNIVSKAVLVAAKYMQKRVVFS
jgi:hypothetical protein